MRRSISSYSPAEPSHQTTFSGRHIARISSTHACNLGFMGLLELALMASPVGLLYRGSGARAGVLTRSMGPGTQDSQKSQFRLSCSAAATAAARTRFPTPDPEPRLPRTLDWQHLLPDGRDAGAAEPPSLARSPFQRDHDRILFSGSFRRLADKTQVFPLPFDDHVHSRLTHSLEVATIGRSLGTLVGRTLVAQGVSLPGGRGARDLGDCVAAACLAHDLGNPPFGHIGESAIQEYFARQAPAGLMDGLTERERQDLLRFEGNAQAFRILTRLERPWRRGGLALTHATIGAFLKYPCTADVAAARGPGRSAKKHGLMAGELSTWERIAPELGRARR